MTYARAVSRYALNYAPFGVAYRVCNMLPCKLLIVSVRELYRAHQIHAGFVYASAKFDCTAAIALYSVVVGSYSSSSSSYCGQL